MRIQQLRFRNLNSLVGEWCIDFTHPAYVSGDGIFAITGSTGSGKTTILDAICLALYGQTPRLERISESTNEVMSRNTGDCLAEVVFESQKGQFICTWSQRKAHGKSTGKLQAPKHEIVDFISGRILEEKLSRVPAKVIEATGLDYHQFTRSMMLAQGDFATFLNASADERAPILEKITGTAIYSIISKKVHERSVVEEDKRTELKEKIGNVEVLTPEKEKELRDTFRQKDLEVKSVTLQQTQLKEAADRARNIARLETELADLEKRRIDLEERKVNATEDLIQLSRAKKALLLETSFTKLDSARNLACTYEDDIKSQVEILAIRNSSLKESLSLFESAQISFTSLKSQQENEKGTLIQVRELDTRIREIQKQLKEKDGELKHLLEKMSNYEGIIAGFTRELGEKTALLEKSVSYLNEHKSDSRLSGDLSGLEQRFGQYLKICNTIEKNQEKLEAQKELFTQTDRLLSDEKKTLDEMAREYENLKQEKDTMENDYKILLNCQSLDFWRKCESDLKERKSHLEWLLGIFEAVESHKEKILELDKKHADLTVELEREKEYLAGLEKEHRLNGEILAKSEENIILTRKVKSLEEERIRLVDGKPCPLCGSLDHPYFSQNSTMPDIDESEYARNKDAFQNIQTKVHLQENKVLIADGIIRSNRDARNEKESQIKDLLESMELGFDDVLSVTESCHLKEVIINALHLGELYRSWCLDICESAMDAEKVLIEKRVIATTRGEALTDLATSRREVEFKREVALKNTNDLVVTIGSLLTDCKTISESLLLDLHDFGIDPLAPDTVSTIISSLKGRKLDYEASLEKQTETQKEIERLINGIQHNQGLVEEAKKSTQLVSKIIGEKEAQLKELTSRRVDLYSDKDPGIEESRMADIVGSAEKKFQEEKQTKTTLESEIFSVNDRILKIKEKSVELSESIRDLEKIFIEGILKAGFPSEEGFVKARLPKDRFEVLEGLEKELLLEENEISLRSGENSRILEEERTKVQTSDTLEKLVENILTFDNQITILNQEIGSIRERLKQHEELLIIKRGLIESLDKQKLECLRWEKLHDLIGSANGQKFREFAQGLTFQTLVTQANHHLRRMSDRYILVRNKKLPLDLDIKDEYQAGEIRSTKNLSGGESFIVSLALALGLSGMASRNVQIDSLFLDEGFGTLDNETLEVALDALSGLHQEGKIIGVISHVPALKERISTQIVVEKTTGGRSRLIGPGCSSGTR